MKIRFITISLFVLFSILSRFIPHPPNFTPLIGVGLFAGAYMSQRIWAFILPVSIMFLSDIFLGLHSTMIWVYGSMMLVVVIGMFVGRKVQLTSVTGGSILGAGLFFLFTNFGVWVTGGGFAHPLTIAGLIQTYVDGIPFFSNTLFSSLLFSGILFGSYEFLANKLPWADLVHSSND